LAARWQTVVEPVATAVAELLGSEELRAAEGASRVELRAEVLSSTAPAERLHEADSDGSKEVAESKRLHVTEDEVPNRLESPKMSILQDSCEKSKPAMQAQSRFHSLASTADTEAMSARLHSLSSFNAETVPSQPPSVELEEPEEIDLESAPAHSGPNTPTAESNENVSKSDCCSGACFQQVKTISVADEENLPVVQTRKDRQDFSCWPEEKRDGRESKERAVGLLPPPEQQSEGIELHCCMPTPVCKPFSLSFFGFE